MRHGEKISEIMTRIQKGLLPVVSPNKGEKPLAVALFSFRDRATAVILHSL